MLRLDRDQFDYVPYYCEENVWRLLGRRELAGLQAWAIIASNRAKRILLMRQRAGRPADGLIVWDYHVFALVSEPKLGMLVLDLDTDLPFPCPARRYVEDCFPQAQSGEREPKFRMLSAGYFTSQLVSDRSHMRKSDGSYLATPPPWDSPGARTKKPNNLGAWISAVNREPGRLLKMRELVRICSGVARPPVEGTYNNV